jgi:hypothetical protein
MHYVVKQAQLFRSSRSASIWSVPLSHSICTSCTVCSVTNKDTPVFLVSRMTAVMLAAHAQQLLYTSLSSQSIRELTSANVLAGRERISAAVAPVHLAQHALRLTVAYEHTAAASVGAEAIKVHSMPAIYGSAAMHQRCVKCVVLLLSDALTLAVPAVHQYASSCSMTHVVRRQ